MIMLYYFVIYVLLELKNIKKFVLLLVIICFIFMNPFEQKTFNKTFEGNKNITTHIRKEGNKNIIFYKKLKEDKYYFNNLEQYLLAQKIYNIDSFYTNESKNYIRFNKINVKNIVVQDF
jgi:hypothetical protein